MWSLKSPGHKFWDFPLYYCITLDVNSRWIPKLLKYGHVFGFRPFFARSIKSINLCLIVRSIFQSIISGDGCRDGQRWWLENYVSISRDDTLKTAAPSLSRRQRWWLENYVTISRDDTMKNAAPSLPRSQRWWIENYITISRDDIMKNAAPSL